MIKFVVCDDKKEIVDGVSQVIDKVMLSNKIVYEKKMFNSYDKEFYKLVNEKSYKIYILDIEVGSKSGIDMARMIRNVDSESIIIFLTSHLEEGFNVLKGDFMCLSFISKLDNYKGHLERSLKKALKFSHNKTLTINEKGVLFNVKLDDILYIYRDTFERKAVVVTTNNIFKVNRNLNEFEDDFIRSHRACLINKARVTKVDIKNKKIVFDNGIEINFLSDAYKENLKWS